MQLLHKCRILSLHHGNVTFSQEMAIDIRTSIESVWRFFFQFLQFLWKIIFHSTNNVEKKRNFLCKTKPNFLNETNAIRKFVFFHAGALYLLTFDFDEIALKSIRYLLEFKHQLI